MLPCLRLQLRSFARLSLFIWHLFFRDVDKPQTLLRASRRRPRGDALLHVSVQLTENMLNLETRCISKATLNVCCVCPVSVWVVFALLPSLKVTLLPGGHESIFSSTLRDSELQKLFKRRKA